MPNRASCLDPLLFRKLLLREVPAAEVAALWPHLKDPGALAALARGLPADTPLGQPQADPRLEALRQRLAQLRPDLAGAGPAAHAATPQPAESTSPSEPSPPPTPFAAFLSKPEQADELGRLGGYRVLKLLGEGGMGVVFLAEDVLLCRRVALKVMRPEVARSATARERFLREARSTAAVEHEHIVTIYQVGEDNGVPFLAMPLLRGETLHDRLHHLQGALPLPDALRIGREIAEGLAAAHGAGLIHRDVKPANIWLESAPAGDPTPPRRTGGRVKLLDFGLARTSASPSLTQSGVVVGTPAYMAPEQARNELIDHRADLFSLGCILYEMTTGARPFTGGDTMAVLMSLAWTTRCRRVSATRRCRRSCRTSSSACSPRSPTTARPGPPWSRRC
jgi:serine/threonine protein kinase